MTRSPCDIHEMEAARFTTAQAVRIRGKHPAAATGSGFLRESVAAQLQR
jgi:hypothetical protein